MRATASKAWSWAALAAISLLLFAYALARPNPSAHVLFTPAQQQCVDGQHRDKSYTYCIYTPRASSNGGVVYHFHGRGLSASRWNDASQYTGMLQAQWEARGVRPPSVVSVSFGPEWLMLPTTKNESSGALQVLLEVILPAAEKVTGVPRYRLALGASMGGLNALLSGLHTRSVFGGIAALCPPIYPLRVRPRAIDFWQLATQQGASLRSVLGLAAVSHKYVQSEEDWRALSVFDLLSPLDPKTAPKLYLSAGLQDEYGNFHGAQALAQAALQSGFDVTWQPLFGGHCVADISSLADWLIH